MLYFDFEENVSFFQSLTSLKIGEYLNQGIFFFLSKMVIYTNISKFCPTFMEKMPRIRNSPNGEHE